MRLVGSYPALKDAPAANESRTNCNKAIPACSRSSTLSRANFFRIKGTTFGTVVTLDSLRHVRVSTSATVTK
jgi:hypothetical protein